MTTQDLPRTLQWVKAERGWKPSAPTATGLDEDAPHLSLIDQRLLPHALEYVDCYTSGQVCAAIESLAVRGAPALGIAGAYALVLWARNEWPLARSPHREGATQAELFLEALHARAGQIAATRPTAVNLSWGVQQLCACAQQQVQAGGKVPGIVLVMEARAQRLEAEDEACSQRIGSNGAAVLAQLAERLGRPLQVQTHCNAGSLATVHLGTATAAIYAAHERGLIANVWVDETRPVDQGARLTAWEMERAGVPYTLVCDDMAGSLMQQGKVDAIIVGADRICANGDVANKIGTYPLAVLAKHHGVPFYVAAPASTFDGGLASGEDIVIEQRDAREVRCMPSGRDWLPVAPQDAPVYNPAFDVTPAGLITALITD